MTIAQQILLEKLRGLLQNAPPLEGRGSYGQDQFAWLGRASSLISSWDEKEGLHFGIACKFMAGNMNRQANFGTIFTTIHKAIASIEEAFPCNVEQSFGLGAMYDFFKALNELVASAKRSLFIVDPYMDAEIFDGYLCALTPGKAVRLLVKKSAGNVQVAAEKFQAQNSTAIQVHKSSQIHDRLVFVDELQCWVLGASIKDAAIKAPTYLAPLATDVSLDKLRYYEDIWARSMPI